MKAYYKYVRRKIEEVYIDNMIIKDFDEMVDKIYSLVNSWEFMDDYDGLYAFEIIYNGDNPVGVNPIDYYSLVKKDSATWIQYPNDPSNKRILYSTQLLILENRIPFMKKNREEKIKDIIDEESNSI